MLCNPGEYFLTEEWTYPSALSSAGPTNVNAIPVAVDGEGLLSGALRKVLAEWDESSRGAKRWDLCLSTSHMTNIFSTDLMVGLTMCSAWVIAKYVLSSFVHNPYRPEPDRRSK